MSAPAETRSLHLDDASLEADQLSMPALMRELNQQKKPFWLLVKLMNALEKKRQGQGLGWSRAWNKYGLTVFRAHTQRAEDADADLARLRPLLDGALMSFTFFHNHTTDDGRQYEGLTFSLGRRVRTDATKRDRLDIVLEDERVDGRVDGRVDRLRVYVCPWSTYGPDRSFHLCERTEIAGPVGRMAQDLFEYGVETYNRDKYDASRQWSHWSVRYIDYFGPRSFIPRGSSFA